MPMKVKNMKGIDLFCTSPASTAICSSTDHRSMVRNGSKPLHHHRLRDHYKAFSNNNNLNHSNYSSPNSRLAPCISELPFTPRPSSLRRKSSADVSDLRRDNFIYGKSNNTGPPRGHSSRYLLGDSPFLDSLSESETYTTSNKCLALVPSTPVHAVRSEERELTKSRSTGAARLGSLMDAEKENAKKKMVRSYSNKQTERNTSYGTDYAQKNVGQLCHTNSTVVKSSSSASSRDQVVVLRVSLHCKGCAGKLRKYLSKMEGVRSFSIDLETKKVTVIGDVTPLGVLSSISKVKNAQLWPSPPSSSSKSSSSLSSSSTLDFNY